MSSSVVRRALSMMRNEAWRERPLRTTTRVGASLIRKRIPSLRRAAVSYGEAKMIADLGTALGLELYRYGKRDPAFCLFCRFLRPCAFFVEGGVNIGLFTIAAAARVGSGGRVLSFEPAQHTRSLLQENAQLNAFSWIEIRENALADDQGLRELRVFDGDGAGLTSFSPESGGGHIETVTTTTLDQALGAAKPRLVKLDLEGAEYCALLGAQKLLRSPGCLWMLELEPSHLERQGASLFRVTELLTSCGHRVYTPLAGAKQRERPTVARGIERQRADTPNVLAIHADVDLESLGISVVS